MLVSFGHVNGAKRRGCPSEILYEICLGKRSASGPEGACKLAVAPIPGRVGRLWASVDNAGFCVVHTVREDVHKLSKLARAPEVRRSTASRLAMVVDAPERRPIITLETREAFLAIHRTERLGG